MIGYRSITLLSCTAAIVVAASAAPPRPQAKVQQKVTGPVANYWVSAATSSGTGLMNMGMSGGHPSIGEVMRAMRGGRQINHALVLQLGSTQTTSDPKADHTSGTSQPLPLVTPKETPTRVEEETVEEQPTMTERPKGRLLIYWGCGEHAGPGQPYVLDLSKISAGQPLPRLPFVAIHHQNPPSAGRYATYGEWPNSRSRAQPPASLVGDHVVRGSYSPDIHFVMPPDRDYMPPLVINTNGRSTAGATLLSWGPVSGTTGYFATMIGASSTAGGSDPSIVMWSSSATQTFAGGGLLDYLAPAEARRLIGLRVVMPPSQTQCAIPVEVSQGAPIGLLSMIAYGDEVNVSDPPRPADPHIPWNISWTTKVRFKSTTGTMLGVAGASGMTPPAGGNQSSADSPAAGPRRRKGGLLNTFKDMAGAIPH